MKKRAKVNTEAVLQNVFANNKYDCEYAFVNIFD